MKKFKLPKEKYLALKIYDEESIKKVKLPPSTWTTVLLKLKTGEVVVAEWHGEKFGWGMFDVDLIDSKGFNKTLKADLSFYDGMTQAEYFFKYLKKCFIIKTRKY